MNNKLNFLITFFTILFLIILVFLNYQQKEINKLRFQNDELIEKISLIEAYTKKPLVDVLSPEQLKILDEAPLDTTSKFEDMLFPDGSSIFEWACVNDRTPEIDKKCIERGL